MKIAKYLAPCVLFAMLAACGGPTEPAAVSNTLQRGLPADPETLDYHKARSTQAAEVLRDLGEGLAGYSAAGELIPAAAESWDIADDGLVYTFHLREGLRWSNGDALTADHFVAGMRRLVNPATAAFYAQY
jgi:oligopeptide transport system substrate-binding protein